MDLGITNKHKIVKSQAIEKWVRNHAGVGGVGELGKHLDGEEEGGHSGVFRILR